MYLDEAINFIEETIAEAYESAYEEMIDSNAEEVTEFKSDLHELGDARINALRKTNKHGSGKDAYKAAKGMASNTRKLIRTAKDLKENNKFNNEAKASAKMINDLKTAKRNDKLAIRSLKESVDELENDIYEAYIDDVIDESTFLEFVDILETYK